MILSRLCLVSSLVFSLKLLYSSFDVAQIQWNRPQLVYHFNWLHIMLFNPRCHETNHSEVNNTVHFFVPWHTQRSDLIYLILLASVHSLWIRRRPQPELRIAEVSVSVDIVQAFPDDFLLCQETLVCNQEVQLTLKKHDLLCAATLEVTGDTYSFVYTGIHRILSELKVSGLHFPFCR